MEMKELRKARNDDIVLDMNKKIKNSTALSETKIIGSSKTL